MATNSDDEFECISTEQHFLQFCSMIMPQEFFSKSETQSKAGRLLELPKTQCCEPCNLSYENWNYALAGTHRCSQSYADHFKCHRQPEELQVCSDTASGAHGRGLLGALRHIHPIRVGTTANFIAIIETENIKNWTEVSPYVMGRVTACFVARYDSLCEPEAKRIDRFMIGPERSAWKD